MLYLKSTLGLAVVAVCLGLQGCAAPPPAPVVQPDAAAVAIDLALQRKAGEKPIGPETPVAAPVYGASTTVSFLGDASTLLANAAKGRANGWTFVVAGPHPRLPIYVQINVKAVSFTAFLQDVADQLGQRADIELNGKTITLRYRSHG